MIAKEVNYDLGIEEWKNLLDQPGLTAAQQKMARIHLAGLLAEKNMAYYLKVLFGQRPDFQVIHNLKVEHDDLTAQIDHLVLTRWTAYFIESKSVSQVIAVNEHGEWGRIHNRRFTPMESPVEQSRRHQAVLYDFMTARRDQFMGKLLGLKLKHFRKLLTPVHYVAISPHGQIKGRGRRRFPEVKKADQVPQAILAYHDSLNKNILTGWNKEEEMPAFNEREFAAAIAFLLEHNVARTPMEFAHQAIDEIEHQAKNFAAKEREASEAELTDVPMVDVDREYRCRKCDSTKLTVLGGPYGYYFKCADCQGNTPIVEMCDECGQKMRVSKSGEQFLLACPKCNVQRSFQTGLPTKADAPAPATVKAATSTQEPRCPKCGAAMKLRTAKRGDNAGGQFWGCTNFPRCRGIVQA